MAQHVRVAEIEDSPPRRPSRQRAAALPAALERFVAAFEGNPQTAGFTVPLLELALGYAKAATVPATLPEAEAKIWRHVGARTDSPSALAQARAMALAKYAEVFSRSIMGDAAVARYLKVDRSRISQRIAERSLFAIPVPGDRMFPRWQFVEHKILPGLREVLVAFDETHPIVIDAWMTTPDDELDLAGTPLSPIVWLQTGGSAAVVADHAALL